MRVSKENHAFFVFSKIIKKYEKSLSLISDIYRKFTHLFWEKKSVKALFKHQT